jgi:hypothetical protein
MKFAVGLAVIVLAAIGASGAGATTECAGVQTCIDVPGPWVAVSAQGEARFLLECPKRQGTVVGVDALATSRDIHVTFDGLLGGPVGPGRTTGSYIFFRGVSGRHRVGLFEPRIGCSPPPNGGPQTTAFQLTPAGAALNIAATTLPVAPGSVRHLTLGCVRGQSLVDSWDATAFPTPVPPALAAAVHVQRSVGDGGQVSITIVTSGTLPRAAHALVQVGVRCAA